MQAAVRVLHDQRRQALHATWVRGARERLAGVDLTPLRVLAPPQGYQPDFLSPPPAGGLGTTIEEELARVRATPTALVATELGRAVAHHRGGGAAAASLRRLAAEPERTRARVADLLERVWTLALAPVWPRVRDVLDRDVAFHARLVAEEGLSALLERLHPGVSRSGTSVRLQHTGPFAHLEARRDLAGQGLVLQPSAFTWPDPVAVIDEPWQPTLIYPARGAAGLWASDRRDPRALDAVLGRARAALLADCALPATTGALAVRLGLAPSTVSAHLQALRDAGLLTATRHGREVRYAQSRLGAALIAGVVPASRD